MKGQFNASNLTKLELTQNQRLINFSSIGLNFISRKPTVTSSFISLLKNVLISNNANKF